MPDDLPDDVTPQTLTEAVFDLSMAIDRVGNAAAGRIGINQTDLICLFLLIRRGPTSPSTIAEELGLTTAAISAVASRLEAGGYARRDIDPTDRRRILLSASAAGAQRAFSLFDDLFQATAKLLTAYQPAERQRLAGMLAAYRDVLVRHADSLKAT